MSHKYRKGKETIASGAKNLIDIASFNVGAKAPTPACRRRKNPQAQLLLQELKSARLNELSMTQGVVDSFYGIAPGKVSLVTLLARPEMPRPSSRSAVLI